MKPFRVLEVVQSDGNGVRVGEGDFAFNLGFDPVQHVLLLDLGQPSHSYRKRTSSGFLDNILPLLGAVEEEAGGEAEDREDGVQGGPALGEGHDGLHGVAEVSIANVFHDDGLVAVYR